MDKKAKTIIICLVIVIVLLSGYIIIDKTLLDEEVKQKQETSSTISQKIKNIEDTSLNIEGFMCATALYKFYEDSNNEYYYSCEKSQYIIVTYEDGSSQTVEEALKNNKIKISDLDTYSINYYTELK